MIYKICPLSIWRKGECEGSFSGAGIDQRDGYIPFSTAFHLRYTAFRRTGRPARLLGSFPFGRYGNGDEAKKCYCEKPYPAHCGLQAASSPEANTANAPPIRLVIRR